MPLPRVKSATRQGAVLSHTAWMLLPSPCHWGWLGHTNRMHKGPRLPPPWHMKSSMTCSNAKMFAATGATVAHCALCHAASSRPSDRANCTQDMPSPHPVEGRVLEVQRLARRALALLACGNRMKRLQRQATASMHIDCGVNCWNGVLPAADSTAYRCTGRGSSRQSLAPRPCGAAKQDTKRFRPMCCQIVQSAMATTAADDLMCTSSTAHLHGNAPQRRAIRRHVEEHDCTSGGHAFCQQTQPDEE